MGVLQKLLDKYELAVGKETTKVETDLLTLDYVLDGGVPLGKIIEIYGENGCGKTTLSMYILSKFVEKFPNKSVVFVDAEYSFNADWARKLSIDTEQLLKEKKLYIVYPRNMDEAFSICLDAAKTDEVSLIILDSLAVLLPKEVFDENDPINFSRPGLGAKKQTMFFETIAPLLEKNNITMIVINQVRANISPYGAQKSVPGAYAFKHLTSVRLEVKRDEFIGDKDNQFGIVSTIKCHKNKTGIPFRMESFVINVYTGLDVVLSNVEFMISRSVIKHEGAIYTVKDTKLRGKNQVIEFLSKNKEVYRELVEKCKNMIYSHSS